MKGEGDCAITGGTRAGAPNVWKSTVLLTFPSNRTHVHAQVLSTFSGLAE